MARSKRKLGTVLGLITATIYLATGLVVMTYINVSMREEGLEDARRLAQVILEQNLAIHAYFTQQLKPNIFAVLEEKGRSADFFDPVLMSSTYAVRWIETYAQKNGPLLSSYRYKSSAVNARSHEYEANAFEVAYLDRANSQKSPEDWSGVVTQDGVPYFVYFKPNIRFEKACMRCHSEPRKAPAALVKMYGDDRSFGKKAGQLSSVISLRIPLAAAYGRANKTSIFLCAIYALLMLVAWVVKSYILRRLVVDPVRTVRDQAIAIASGQSTLGDQIPLAGYEEMNDLTAAFNKMSSRLKSHQDDLIEVVAKRTEELENAYSGLKKSQAQLVQNEKMASIGLLAAGVAHEINNPIGFVKSNLSSLEKYFSKLVVTLNACCNLIEENGNDETKVAAKNILRQNKYAQICEDFPELIAESANGIERVSTIVQNLKTFSRTDNNKLSCCDLNESIESTLSIVWNELKYKINIHKDYAELSDISCNLSQISQVFMNLLVNAGHAIEEKGDIWLKTWQEGEWACISIADNGCGMSEETQRQLFEPFYTTKEAGNGTGLGMSIVNEIIQKHSASIAMESVLGLGSKFTIYFPLADHTTE